MLFIGEKTTISNGNRLAIIKRIKDDINGNGRYKTELFVDGVQVKKIYSNDSIFERIDKEFNSIKSLKKLKELSELGLAMMDLYCALDDAAIKALNKLSPDFYLTLNQAFIKPLDAIDELKSN